MGRVVKPKPNSYRLRAALLSALFAAAFLLVYSPGAASAPGGRPGQAEPTPTATPAPDEAPPATPETALAPDPTATVDAVAPQLQPLPAPQSWGQALVSDGQFVWGPNVGDFEIGAFLNEHGSPLAAYSNAVEVNAAYYGINPRVLLAVLEARYGLVTAPGNMDGAALTALVEQTSLSLHNAFYDHLYQWGSRARTTAPEAGASIALADGASLQVAPGTSSGSYAVAAVLGEDQPTASVDALLAVDAQGGFEATFSELFPGVDPLDTSNDINPDSLPPGDLFQFPFPLDAAWRFSGVHSWAGGDIGLDRSSMDFSISWPEFPDFPYKNAVAAASGSARIRTPYSGRLPCWVEVDHGGGWMTSYYHLRNIGTTSGSIGAFSRNQLIGAIGMEVCNGGFASGAHVHFTLWYNGALFDLEGVKLSGWTVHQGPDGSNTYNSGFIERDGVTLTPWHNVLNDYQEYFGSEIDYSLRFYGTGGGVDRLRIPVIDLDSELTSGPPFDLGYFDLSLEWWMRTIPGGDSAPAITCGANDNWKDGNLLFDRSRGAGTREWGVSIAGGRIAFGVTGPTGSKYTLCSSSIVNDGEWHHILVQRNRYDSSLGYADGQLWLFVDGVREGYAVGPIDDISYPDGAALPSTCGPGGNQPCSDDPYLVVGASKYDAGLAFSGWLDDVRASYWIRYQTETSFTPPIQPLTRDSKTVGLLSFNEGGGAVVYDTGGYDGGTSNGWVIAGGTPAGPAWNLAVPYVELQHIYLPLIQR